MTAHFSFLHLRIFCHSIFNFLILILNFSLFNFHLLIFMSFQPYATVLYTYSPSYTFYTIFHSLYIILLLHHSVCFILYDMLHILIRYLLYIFDKPPLRVYCGTISAYCWFFLLIPNYCTIYSNPSVGSINHREICSYKFVTLHSAK
jgi:hypothetical protein